MDDLKLIALTTISRPEGMPEIPLDENGYPVRSIFIEPGEEFFVPADKAETLVELGFAKYAEKPKAKKQETVSEPVVSEG